MAVINVSYLTVQQGRMETVIELVKRGKALLESHGGGRNYRLFAPVAGREAFTELLLIWESDDLASWGAANDGIFGDPALQDLFPADTPTERTVQSVFMEVPLT
jgi:hypothetical protein